MRVGCQGETFRGYNFLWNMDVGRSKAMLVSDSNPFCSENGLSLSKATISLYGRAQPSFH